MDNILEKPGFRLTFRAVYFPVYEECKNFYAAPSKFPPFCALRFGICDDYFV